MKLKSVDILKVCNEYKLQISKKAVQLLFNKQISVNSNLGVTYSVETVDCRLFTYTYLFYTSGFHEKKKKKKN